MVADVAEQVQQGLRALVVEQVRATPEAKRRLADGLKVPEASVDRMMTAERWELPLALSAAQFLGVNVSVTRSL